MAAAASEAASTIFRPGSAVDKPHPGRKCVTVRNPLAAADSTQPGEWRSVMKEENLTIFWPCCPNLNFPPILQVDKSRRLHGTFPLATWAALERLALVKRLLKALYEYDYGSSTELCIPD
jgi:hypothetical protein